MLHVIDESGVKGFLHEPDKPNKLGLVLTHGAGANCRSSLLQQVAAAFAADGWAVLRCDLAFRQAKPFGPPHPSLAMRDRESLRLAAAYLARSASEAIVLGGHSYGGRQASVLLSEDASAASALLLFSYPLHPPKRPEKPRTAHWPALQSPALFVHGTVDPFGSIAELQEAFALLPARPGLSVVDGAGHELHLGKFDVLRTAIEPLHAILGK